MNGTLSRSHRRWTVAVNFAACVVLFAALVDFLITNGALRFLRLAVFAAGGALAIARPRGAVLVFVALTPLLPGVSRQFFGIANLSLPEHMLIPLLMVAAVRALGDPLTRERTPADRALAVFVALTIVSMVVGLISSVGRISAFIHCSIPDAVQWATGPPLLWHFSFALEHVQREEFVLIHDTIVIAEGALVYVLLTGRQACRPLPLARALSVGAVGAVLVGIVQWFFPWNQAAVYNRVVQPDLFRINATLADPNILGCYLVLVSPVVAVTLLQWPRRRGAGAAAALAWIAAAGACLILSNSRSALVGLAVALVASGLLAAWRPAWFGVAVSRRRRRLVAAAVIAVVTAVVALSLVITFTSYGDQASYGKARSRWEVLQVTLDLKRPLGVIVTGRPLYWEAAINMWREHPWFGVGIGSYPRLKNSYLPEGHHLVPFHSSHNYYLKILSELGLTGLAAFLAVLAAIVVQIRRAARGADAAGRRRVAAVAIGLAAFLVSSISADPLMLIDIQYVFWTVVALLVLEQRRSRALPAPV